jgi:hypothetical protein
MGMNRRRDNIQVYMSTRGTRSSGALGSAGVTPMALSAPSANGDLGEEGKIIIELVKAPRRDD